MNVLHEIVAAKRKEVEQLKRQFSFEDIKQKAELGYESFVKRPFRKLFDDTQKTVLIAEVKPRSPSEGELTSSPLEIADMYAKSEADAISVLTDKKYFGGSLELLKQVRAKVPQTILRKDFILEPYQVYETVLSGADAFLLIAAVLSVKELRDLWLLGKSMNLDSLVEVHDEKDVQKALEAGADLIGINNRDLKSLKTDLAITEHLMKKMPQGTPVISESGIYTEADAKRVRACGVRGILVGTSILQSPNPLQKISELKNGLIS